MQVTILGTGTSQGVPVIGCKCEVCLSDNPKDKRLRCSLHLQINNLDIVVDVGPDFRQQMLGIDISKLDALLITHEHNDHIIGLDDVRPFNFRQKVDLPVYAATSVQSQLKQRFEYAFSENPYPGVPKLNLLELIPGKPFSIGELEIIPIPVIHGNIDVLGFRIQDFTYITDVNYIPEESWPLIMGTKHLILSALHHSAHHSHFNLVQALKVIERIQPIEAFLTHISHLMGKSSDINPTLPSNVKLAYDGQRLIL